jgi:hypothetical protein
VTPQSATQAPENPILQEQAILRREPRPEACSGEFAAQLLKDFPELTGPHKDGSVRGRGGQPANGRTQPADETRDGDKQAALLWLPVLLPLGQTPPPALRLGIVKDHACGDATPALPGRETPAEESAAAPTGVFPLPLPFPACSTEPTAAELPSIGAVRVPAGNDDPLPTPDTASKTQGATPSLDGKPAEADAGAALAVAVRVKADPGATYLTQDRLTAAHPQVRLDPLVKPADAGRAEGGSDPATAIRAAISGYEAAQTPTAAKRAPDVDPVPAESGETAPLRAETTPARPTRALQNLALEILQPNQERVALHVVERSGELHVAIRTADSELAHGLRQALPELVNRLEQDGLRIEVWRPAGVATAGAAIEARRSASDVRDGDPQPQQNGSQQQRGQRDQDPSDRPRWVEELESSYVGGVTHTGD